MKAYNVFVDGEYIRTVQSDLPASEFRIQWAKDNGIGTAGVTVSLAMQSVHTSHAK